MELAVLIGSLLSFFGYTVTNRLPYTRSLETRIDKKITYYPIFVIPYLSLFPYIVYAYFATSHTESGIKFLVTVLIANVAASLFWYFFPNGVKRFEVPETNLFSRILNFVYKHDGDVNGFPSGHVYLSIISTYFLWITQSSLWWVWLIINVLITLSILFTKQHYVIDILGGIIFAAVPIVVTNLWLF